MTAGRSILVFLIILVAQVTQSQDIGVTDSLENVILQTNDPEKKVDLLIDLAAKYFYTSDLDKAMDCAVKARDLARDNGMDLYLAQSYDGIGAIYYDLGNQAKSSENFFASLKIYEKLNDKDGIGATFCRIGTLYFDQKDYERAADYYVRSIELAREIDSKEGIASNLNNLAKVYSEKREFEKALQTYEEALRINIQTGESYLEASNYLNIADVYLKMKNYKAAIEKIEQARLIFSKIGNKLRLAKSQLLLSEIYLENGNSNSSRQLARDALGIGLEQGYKEITVAAASIMNRIYLASGDSAAAFRYFMLEKQYEDSLALDEKQKTLSSLELQYRFEKNEQALKLAQQRKNAVIFIISAFFFFSIIILFLIMKQYRLRAKKLQLEKAAFERELEFKNKEMVLNVMSLMKKNEMLADLSEKLILIEKEATSPESRDTLKKVAKELQKNQEEEIWKEFSTRFKEVHGEFYDKLLKKFPALTPNELKLCAFLRLNMSSKDIAELTGQRVSSLETARYRLRQKLGIANSDVNLITYLSSI
jgi:tetratricopeptide (TPR) repeat protein/DNA-binding CsgD family transcriptional regulator